MENLQKYLNEYKENLKANEEKIAEAYKMKSNAIKAYHCIFNNTIEDLLKKNDKLVFKIDDSIYMLYSRIDNGVFVSYPHSNITWFTVVGLGFSFKHGNLLSNMNLLKHEKVDIVSYDEFIEQLNLFKEKYYNTDNANVEYQYHHGTPYRDYDIMEDYPEYFKEKYIEEFYIKLNNYEDELYEEM